jgi:hypothetical protein
MNRTIEKNKSKTKVFSKLFFCFKYIVLSIVYLLCIPAVYFTFAFNLRLAGIITWGFTALVPLLLVIFRKKKYIYPALLGCCTLFIVFFFTFYSASNNRNWSENVAVLPSVSFEGNTVTIKNIRFFKYTTENNYVEGYYKKTVDVDNIDSLDCILSYWDGNTEIAHTMLSFGFTDNTFLCVSVETRLENREPQSGLGGLYNQYELIYILADEKDLLGLRTNFRKEEVFVYPIKIKKKNLKKLFLQIMHNVKNLETNPRFYNTLKDNCFTSLLNDVRAIKEGTISFDYRFIMNGRSDELGYERGLFNTNGLSFKEFKNVHHINQYIPGSAIPDNYSLLIRQ